MTALVGSLVLVGCGGESSRDRVKDYIEQASAIQRQSTTEFRKANDAYVSFSQGKVTGTAAATKVRAAERTIKEARDRLARVKAPREATRLHSRLLRLYDQNLQFARETTRLALYLPGADTAMLPLPEVNAALQRQLRAGVTPQRQARALRRFVAGIDSILADLRALDVPYVLLPGHGDQVTRLRRTRDVADRLRSALLQRDAKRVARTLRSFRDAVTKVRERKRLAAQALRHYNRRYRDLNRAAAAVREEEARLDRLYR